MTDWDIKSVEYLHLPHALTMHTEMSRTFPIVPNRIACISLDNSLTQFHFKGTIGPNLALDSKTCLDVVAFVFTIDISTCIQLLYIPPRGVRIVRRLEGSPPPPPMHCMFSYNNRIHNTFVQMDTLFQHADSQCRKCCLEAWFCITRPTFWNAMATSCQQRQVSLVHKRDLQTHKMCPSFECHDARIQLAVGGEGVD